MKRKSFTILELIIVIGIMALLAGMLMPALNRAKIESQKAATKMLIKNIDMACRTYKNDWGSYPPEDSGTGYTINLWGRPLGGDPYGGLSYTGVLPGGGTGPYLELERDSRYLIDNGTDEYICDYWGRAIYYDVHSDATWDYNPDKNSDFDIWSHGQNDKDDSKALIDDVGNWEEGQ